ncbi:MAG TPA: P-II family nitrogen regulator [Myxococcota bacterium]|nr:P-II family nitrogen regulator [Myxococcota bacterium]
MRKIEAILDSFQLEEVKEALGLIGVRGMTVSEVKGTTPDPTTARYRGSEYAMHLVPKIRIEIAVEDDFADAVVRRLVVTANRGRLTDGTIFVLPMEDAVRIRTGEHGPDAI